MIGTQPQEARIRLEDFPNAMEARGEFELEEASGPPLVCLTRAVLVRKPSAEKAGGALVVAEVWPKGDLTEPPPAERSPGVPVVFEVFSDAEGFIETNMVVHFEGELFDDTMDFLRKLKQEADEVLEKAAPDDQDLDFSERWGKPSFLARLRNAWDALRGRRPWK